MLPTLEGFIGIASNLIWYDKQYDGILKNQLGNVIVASTLECANSIAKKIGYRYRIVTLDGEILHVGGSLTGGEAAKNRNIITEKQELESKLKEKENVIKTICLIIKQKKQKIINILFIKNLHN